MNTHNPNPAFGADLEPYHGIPTFMRLPASRELTCPPKTDPGRMRGSVEKEAKNAKRKTIHTRTNHH